MNIKLLGTGSIYSKYNCASELVDNKILIDAGQGILKQILKIGYNLKDLKMIIITHLHSDHYSDLPGLILNLQTIQDLEPIYVVGPKALKENVKKLCNIFYQDYFDEFIEKKINFIEVDSNTKDITTLNGYKIKVQKVDHCSIESYGYIINSKIGITSDTCLCQEVEKIFRESELIIADTSEITGTKYHMGIDNIEYLENKFKKSIIATHLKDKTREELTKRRTNNILIKEDGFEIEI